MDLQNNWAVLLGAVMQGIALAGVYYGLKADNAALAANLALSILTEKSERRMEQATAKEDVAEITSAIQFAIKELSHRVNTLESGQDEWTKALRKRTHDLADQLNGLVLKIDRLERANQKKGES